jgi:hypothetical protein
MSRICLHICGLFHSSHQSIELANAQLPRLLIGPSIQPNCIVILIVGALQYIDLRLLTSWRERRFIKPNGPRYYWLYRHGLILGQGEMDQSLGISAARLVVASWAT